METIYRMSKDMYYSIKKPGGNRKNNKELTDSEVIQYINDYFGLKDKVVDIAID